MSEYELFQEDLDRLAPHIEGAIKRVPAFAEVGVKKVYNGAICDTPEGNPIVGPAPGLKNFWINDGHSFGITAAGGAGWQLAEWIVDGEPTIDMLGVDPEHLDLHQAYQLLVHHLLSILPIANLSPASSCYSETCVHRLSKSS